jgi:hypothetical protein
LDQVKAVQLNRIRHRGPEVEQPTKLDRSEEDLGASGMVRNKRESELEGAISVHPNAVDFPGGLCRDPMEHHDCVRQGVISDSYLSSKEGDHLFLAMDWSRENKGEGKGEGQGKEGGRSN